MSLAVALYFHKIRGKFYWKIILLQHLKLILLVVSLYFCTNGDESSYESPRSPIRILGHFHRAPFLQSSMAVCALHARFVGAASGGLVARAFRLLLVLVLALAAVEYLFASILHASPLRTYLLHNNTTMINNISIKGKLNMTRNNGSEDMSTPLLITKIMEGIKNLVTTIEHFRDKPLPICHMPRDLGPIPVNKTEIELECVEKRYPDVRSGGLYSSPNCTARHRVAIVVPYRDREQHLPIFLNHMHPFLIKQHIEYGIYIVEQEGTSEFNKAKLMNVGFIESQKLRSWQCFIFHDLDLLPLDSRNLYSCPRQPRHMSASIDKLNFTLPYKNIFGGVSAMTQKQFLRVNGFSNKYWGWGGEDDDMFHRLKEMNYRIVRYKMSIARYAMLDHEKSTPNPKRFQLLSNSSKRFQWDGLSTLKYELLKVTPHHLYTHILVNIDDRS